MNAMILCAGEGTRLRPHTLKHPKPLIPFLTVPIVSYGLEWLREVSPSAYVFNTFHLSEKIHSELPCLLDPESKYFFSDESPNLMGSGGGISKAKRFLSGDVFIVMNGDEIFFPGTVGQFSAALENHRRSGALATLLVMKHPGVGTQFGGVWATTDGRVLGFGKTMVAGSSFGWHFMGGMIFSSEIFDFLPESQPSNILYDCLATAIKQEKLVEAFEVTGWWYESGNEKDYLEATRRALDLLAGPSCVEKMFLEKVLSRFSPQWNLISLDEKRLLQAEPSKPTFSWDGFVVLGKGASCPPLATPKNLVLGNGVSDPPGQTGLYL